MVAAVVLLRSGRNGQVAKSKVLGRVWSPILPIVLVDLNRAHQGASASNLAGQHGPSDPTEFIGRESIRTSFKTNR